MSNPIDQFNELLSNPLGDLIASIGRGVGEAQAALDAGSLAQTLEIYREDQTRSVEDRNAIQLMREIGYQPTFYTIPETECEAQVSLSLGISSEQSSSPIQAGFNSRLKTFATPLNAGNINRYNLNAQAAAKIKFKIVPVPTDAIVAEMRLLPELAGKSFSEGKALLESLGLSYRLETGVVEGQIADLNIKGTIPAYDAQNSRRLRLGDAVVLTFDV